MPSLQMFATLSVCIQIRLKSSKFFHSIYRFVKNIFLKIISYAGKGVYFMTFSYDEHSLWLHYQKIDDCQIRSKYQLTKKYLIHLPLKRAKRMTALMLSGISRIMLLKLTILMPHGTSAGENSISRTAYSRNTSTIKTSFSMLTTRKKLSKITN